MMMIIMVIIIAIIIVIIIIIIIIEAIRKIGGDLKTRGKVVAGVLSAIAARTNAIWGPS